MKTAEKLFELLDSIVEEIREEKIVQVITDNGGKQLCFGRYEVEREEKESLPDSLCCLVH